MTAPAGESPTSAQPPGRVHRPSDRSWTRRIFPSWNTTPRTSTFGVAYPASQANRSSTRLVSPPDARPIISGAIPKSGDFDSAIKYLPGTTCDKMVEDPRSAFNFAGKIHLPTTVSGESSVSENLAPDALEN